MKTLKNIPDDTNYTTAVSRNDLRQVAIEWIKDFRMHKIPHNTLRGHYTSARNYEAKIEWIKMFFNITEKEIKKEIGDLK